MRFGSANHLRYLFVGIDCYQMRIRVLLREYTEEFVGECRTHLMNVGEIQNHFFELL